MTMRFWPPKAGSLPVRSLLALLLLTGAAAAGESAVNPAELERLVHQDCGSCHGLTLKGGLGPDIRPETIEHYDVEGLKAVILGGIPDTAMPPWQPLISDEEAVWIAEYLLKGKTQ